MNWVFNTQKCSHGIILKRTNSHNVKLLITVHNKERTIKIFRFNHCQNHSISALHQASFTLPNAPIQKPTNRKQNKNKMNTVK